MFNLSRLERISILFLMGVLVLGGILYMAKILLTPLPQIPSPVLEREVPQEMPLVPRGLEVPEIEIAPKMIWEETPEIVAKPVFEQFSEAKEVPIPAIETSKIDMNTASKEELTALPGIGPVKARAIIDARPYYSIDELTKARGIGLKTLERLRDLVTIGVGRRMPEAGAEIATHHVREGDTLSEIAESYLGMASAFQELALYNRIKDPDYIFPGEMIRIPRFREGVTLISAALAEEEKVGQGKVNINTASKEELIALPGIGPAKAQAIINNRPYYNVDELTQVMGIGPKILEGLRPLITVGEVAKPAPETPTEREVPVVKRAEVDINTASPSEIQALPGIGPVKAQAIIDARPYYSIDELTKARGIGPKTLERLKPLIAVGEAPPGERPEVRKKLRRKVNINTASQREMESLPGIGPKTARRIIEYRPFGRTSDIQNVPRIGSKTYEKLRDLITVEKPNINSLSYQKLSAISDIGPEIARSIIDYRESHGPFRSMRELKDIPGMNNETYRFLKGSFTIE